LRREEIQEVAAMMKDWESVVSLEPVSS